MSTQKSTTADLDAAGRHFDGLGDVKALIDAAFAAIGGEDAAAAPASRLLMLAREHLDVEIDAAGKALALQHAA
jgi:hypothetical protein